MVALTWAWTESCLQSCLFAIQESGCGHDICMSDGKPPATFPWIVKALQRVVREVDAAKPYGAELGGLVAQLKVVSRRRNEVVHRAAVLLSASTVSTFFYEPREGRYEAVQGPVEIGDLLTLNDELAILSDRVREFAERFCAAFVNADRPGARSNGSGLHPRCGGPEPSAPPSHQSTR